MRPTRLATRWLIAVPVRFSKGKMKRFPLPTPVAAVAGGSGGGKPDSAMAGAKDISKISEALEKTASIVEEMLKRGEKYE